ncbi:MAG TPA: discoidin domain-containing protein, partial [Pyrinomonadaceae bacterium]|nr:discoidin domain-containing protein [Pyrinomonadaceae bacterium]
VWGYNSLCYECSISGGSVGARYDPATNVWRPMNLSGAPAPYVSGYGTNALWTGKEMLVWGGGQGRYNPLTDTWSAISTVNAPLGGWTAVWSGKEMIVWGRNTQEGSDTGGRYDPETDTWRPTSTVGAPVGRSMHTAIWAGTEMVVWGGVQFGVMGKLNTGGRYDPETDTWRPTSTAGAPEGRTYHTAVWTGSEMIIWGGSNATEGGGNAALVNTGARYNPANDSWTPTGTVGAPEARSEHRAVWTGSQMIVWGGAVKGVTGPTGTYTGARYNPSTDVWTPTSTLRAPSKRVQHVQVWTGTQMIVWGGIASEGAATHGAIYNAPGASPEGNLAPSVRLTSPAGGSAFQSGDAVRLTAEVSDSDGTVTTVRFYANDQLVGTDTQAPFEFDWEARGGNFAVTATATDDGNAEARSAAVNITVAPSTAPPACVLTAPADGSTYAYGASVRMEATATANRDRTITRVEFLDNGTVVTYYEPPTYNAPWVYTYLAPASGVHSLTARCTDNAGGVTTSAPKVVTVEDQGYSVSGQLLDDRGFIIAGVRLRLDGPAGTAPQYMTTTVGGNGNYHFGGLKAGETYRVTPEPGQWRFSPESNTYTAISKSWTLQHFYGVRAGYAISGRLTDANGNPVYPATVNLSGSKNATTNVLFDGTYIFYNLAPGGTYTVQPYKNQYGFEPAFRTFENLSAEQTADFVGAPQGTVYSVGGRVVDYKGLPVAGLRIKLGTVRVTGVHYRTTDADGRYTFENIAAGETVQLAPEDFTYKHTYAPTSHSYYGVNQNVTNADFTATPATNVALGKTATQSSTGWGAVATRAVDGNTSGVWTQNSMTTTFSETQAWWEVDLGAVSDIAAVRVWNRTDCCDDRLRDFYLLVSDAPFTSQDLTATLNQAGVASYRVTGPVMPSVTQAVGRTGRYVRVQLAGANYLTLPEVEVLGQAIKPTQSVNLALNTAATQSSTGWGGVASRAADGNTDGNWANNSVTTTFADSQAWWEVDLGSAQQINTVKLWNRSDCCTDRLANFHVLVSDAPFTSKNLTDTLAQAGVTGYHTAGAAGRSTTVNVNRVGRYVRVQLAGANYLSLAEVEVWGAQAVSQTPAVNLSQGKAAAQSSTGWGGVASRAVDGNTGGDWAKNSVTTTFNDAQAWWEVDLGSVRSVQDVKLWNRTDCCSERLSDFYVIVSDVPFASTNLTTTLGQTGVSAFRKSGAAGAQTSIAVGRTGRYVRIQLAGTNYLSLAEVQVMGQ